MGGVEIAAGGAVVVAAAEGAVVAAEVVARGLLTVGG